MISPWRSPSAWGRADLFGRLFANTDIVSRIVLETDDTGSFVLAVSAGIGSTLVWTQAAERMTVIEIRRFDSPRTTLIGFRHVTRPNDVKTRFPAWSVRAQTSDITYPVAG